MKRPLLFLLVFLGVSSCFPVEDILINDDGTVKHDTVYVPTPPDTVILVCDRHHRHCHRWEPSSVE